MKKSVFILFALIVFAGSYALGQATHNSYPLPLVGCATGPLSPIAGNSYNYSALVDPTGGTFQWWATTDQAFIAGGANNIDTRLTVADGELLATSGNYGTGGADDNVDITWASSTLAAAETTPTFVVVQYDAPAGECSNNLKVLKIDPVNGFTVDIKNMFEDFDTTAYGQLVDTCASLVQGASYNATEGNVTYDFGDNGLLFEVVLANFSVSATVDFSIAGLQLGQTADLSWGYTPATAGGTAIDTDLPNGPVGIPITVTSSVPNTGIGVSIYVKAIVNNNYFEGITDADFTLAVNATNAEGDDDVVNDDCETQEDFEDMSTQRILARPTVTDETDPDPDDNFLGIDTP